MAAQVEGAKPGTKCVTHIGATVEILGKCQANSGYWYCLTHKEPFQNQLQKDIHVRSGSHVLAWVCWEHGFEEP
jgi:hypothetical protein